MRSCEDNTENTLREASQAGIAPQMVYRWSAQQKQLQQTSNKKRKRVGGGGAKPTLLGLENELYEEIIALRADGVGVDRSMVKARAREIAIREGKSGFKGSDPWCTGFLHRW